MTKEGVRPTEISKYVYGGTHLGTSGKSPCMNIKTFKGTSKLYFMR